MGAIKHQIKNMDNLENKMDDQKLGNDMVFVKDFGMDKETKAKCCYGCARVAICAMYGIVKAPFTLTKCIWNPTIFIPKAEL